MSKRIKLTPEIIEECAAEFEHKLKSFRSTDGNFEFKKDLGKTDDKATLYFMETAWYKMKALVDGTNKEIAWHGITERGDDNDYYIDDIVVYPQIVTGATVNTDQAKYNDWLMSLPDEQFHNMRFQGHSHVNMGATPSGVDKDYYSGMIDQIKDDGYYIFMIINKKQETWIKIYDMKSNVLFESADIDLRIIPDDLGIQDFLSDINDMVEEYKAPVTQSAKSDKTNSKTSKFVTDYDDEEDDYWSRMMTRYKTGYSSNYYDCYAGYEGI